MPWYRLTATPLSRTSLGRLLKNAFAGCPRHSVRISTEQPCPPDEVRYEELATQEGWTPRGKSSSCGELRPVALGHLTSDRTSHSRNALAACGRGKRGSVFGDVRLLGARKGARLLSHAAFPAQDLRRPLDASVLRVAPVWERQGSLPGKCCTESAILAVIRGNAACKAAI